MRYKSRTRALAASALAASLGLAGLAFTASPAMATEDTDVVRVAGTTRYGTAADAATSAYPGGSANVVLASGEMFPDALAGGGLAGSLDAPILLTQQDAIPADTTAALAELDAETVTILGGTAAVSASVEAALEAAGYTVDRVAGADRFETAALIAEELGGTTAVLANGLRFPDALAISPGAHALELPVLLTGADALQEDAAAYIDTNAVDTVVIVGGTGVVSQDIEDALEADGITVVRLAGETRYETSVEIAEFHVTQGFTLDEVVMATGENFADALAGGPYAAEMGAPMVLTQTATLTPATAAFLAENCQAVDALSILGGTAAITAAVANAAADAAQCDVVAGTATTRPELVSASIVDVVTPGEQTVNRPAGTWVAFAFDENVDTFAPTAGAFWVHTASGGEDAGNLILSRDGNTVVVLFDSFDADSEAAGLTLATVDFGAVEDDQNQENPQGDAALSFAQGGPINLAAGTTSAPDLVSVGGFRQTIDPDVVAVDFTFDSAAFYTGPSFPTNDGEQDFLLLLDDGQVVECAGEGTAGASGQNIPGGNTTATHTVLCDNPNSDTAPILSGDVVRAGVMPFSVADATSTFFNPGQAVDVSSGGNSPDPDLVSATFQPSANPATTPDRVVYTFDEAVQNGTATQPNGPDASNFFVYDVNANPTGASGLGTPAVNPANATQVLIEFPAGTLTNAVGASVNDDAVFALDDGTENAPDEVGVSNTIQPGSVNAGETSDPQLTAVALSQPTDLFGNPGPFVATYVFDEDVTLSTLGDFYLFTSTGTVYQANACQDGSATATTADDATVTCAGYNILNAAGADTGSDATSAQIGATVLGTVDDGAVADDDADAGDLNPEGAALTTGGTGTPAN